MTKIINFEYCALAIELLILISVYQRKMIRGRINRWYVSVIATIALATVTDLIGMWLEMAGNGYTFLKFAANTVCLWASAINAACLCGYLFAQTGLWFKLYNKPYTRRLVYLPAVLITVLMFVINPITKLVFYINADGNYARGKGIALIYSLAFLYLGVGVGITFKFKRLYNARKILSILLLLFSSLIGTFIQMLFPYVIIQMFVVACAALILLLEVQAPEERIHVASGLNSMNAYSQDIKRLFEIDAEFGDTIAVITNYNVLVEMLGYFNVEHVIRQIAEKLTQTTDRMRLEAEHYYLGNGRFAVTIDLMNLYKQHEIAEKINNIFNESYSVGSSEVKIMANVCSVVCPRVIDDPEFLISFDERLDEEPYSGELRLAETIFKKEQFEFKRNFANVIDEAFSNGYFSIAYQPIYSIERNRFNSAEAFLRLNDPVYGYVSPDKVIKEAEKSSVIYAITSYVIEEVCKFISQPEFLFSGLEFVEINMSPSQLVWSDLVTVVMAMVRSYDVQTKYICFDITDIDDAETYNLMKENIDALNQLGFKLVMDDFGSGIFEIERVAKMPLSGVKLDRKFVRMGLEKEGDKILKGTCRMLNDMELPTGAVGVENETSEKMLLNLGVSFLQGYHYCRPVSKDDLIKFMLIGGRKN